MLVAKVAVLASVRRLPTDTEVGAFFKKKRKSCKEKNMNNSICQQIIEEYVIIIIKNRVSIPFLYPEQSYAAGY